jgi:hypothetical protein
MSKELAKGIFDSNVRIVGIWPIFGLSEIPSDVFIEALEYDALPAEIEALIPDYAGIEWDEIEWEEFACECFNKGMMGYLLKADCPVFTKQGESSASFSWGHWRSNVFYGEQPNELIAQAIAWGHSQYEAAIKGGAS